MGPDLVICSESAIDYWRIKAGATFLGADGSPWERLREPRLCDDTSRAAAEVLLELGLTAPLNLLYPSAAQRRTSSIVRAHALSNWPAADDLLRIGPGILVCSPRVAFCQLALTLDDVDLLLLGLELCGTYVKSPVSDAGFLCTSAPVTTLADIQEAAGWNESIVPTRRQKLERITAQLVDGSNSPAESSVFAMFSLPLSRGGLALPGMLLNQTIELDNVASSILGYRKIRPDFYFPSARTVGEYKSRMFHPEGTWTNDDRRLDALGSMGLHTFSLNNERVKKLDELVAIGLSISSRMNRLCMPATNKDLIKRRALHRRLFLSRSH